jgi:rare lipoprotein A
MGAFGRNGRLGHIAHLLVLAAGCLTLGACATNNIASRAGSARGVALNAPAVRPRPHAAKHVFNPKRTVTATEPHTSPANGGYSAAGMASWYGADFHGRRTADGETFDMNSFTAAHRTLPIPCTVRVTDLTNHRSIMVRVNDRGPYVGHRLIDVSARAAKALGFYDRGLTKVKIDYVGRAPPKGPVGE